MHPGGEHGVQPWLQGISCAAEAGRSCKPWRSSWLLVVIGLATIALRGTQTDALAFEHLQLGNLYDPVEVEQMVTDYQFFLTQVRQAAGQATRTADTGAIL
jgi:hypothetical protein